MMKYVRRSVISALFLSALCLAGSPDVTEARMYHYFDQEGNVLTGPKKALTPARSSRHGTPEGIVLRQDVSYEQYPVFGSNFSEIMRSIGENGPYSRKKEKRVPTDISWSLELSYQFSVIPEIDEDSGIVHLTITVSDISMDYHVTVILPALMDDSSLNPIEKGLWKKHFQDLLEHEYSRVKIIKDSGLQTALTDSIAELNYLSLEYSPGLDYEALVSSSLREEIEGLGQEWAKKIKDSIDTFDLTASP